VEPAFWARGNAWAAYFLVEHAIARRECGLPPDAATETARARLFAALLAAQDAESGLWRTDLLGGGSRQNPLETSASALIAAALRRGATLGTIDAASALRARAAAARAIAGVRARIRWERGHPTLLGTSTGTHPGHRAYYRAVPLEENVAHGVGALLLAMASGGRRE
jgi:rhamnogalacturonyl hydrolase YesR